MDAADRRPVIMIVDDTPDNLKLLELLLVERGYEVRLFPKARLALNAALRQPPDLFLLDILMPEMDGFELCRRIKMEDLLRSIPVLFISALSDTVDMVHAFFVGGVDYVTKPFQPDVVHARVQTHLKIQDLQRELQSHNACLEQMVDQRTRELRHSQERLLELSRIKDGLLKIISYELRTPANGILGIGRLLTADDVEPEDLALYRDLFLGSCARLANLIEDTTAIADLEHLAASTAPPRALDSLLADLVPALPGINLDLDAIRIPEPVLLHGDPGLLARALKTFVQLCAAFSRDTGRVALHADLPGQGVRLYAHLDNLHLTPGQIATFFNLESPIRSESPAEELAVAPVLARNIIVAYGGELNLIHEEDGRGRLVALLVRHQDVVVVDH